MELDLGIVLGRAFRNSYFEMKWNEIKYCEIEFNFETLTTLWFFSNLSKNKKLAQH